VERVYTHEMCIRLRRAASSQEEIVTVFFESREWANFWRNTIQGLHDTHRKFTYNENIARSSNSVQQIQSNSKVKS